MRSVLALSLLLLLTLLASAPAASEPPPAPEEIAQRVLETVAAGDEEALARWAAQAGVDPWLVALVLDRAKEDAALTAYVAALRSPEAAGLLRYLSRKDRPRGVSAELDAALSEAGRPVAPESAPPLLARLTATTDTEPLPWRVLAMEAQGELAARLGQIQPSAVALLHAGRLATDLGWLSKAASLLKDAGKRAHRALAFDLMLEAWEALQSVEEIRRIHPGWARATVFLGNAHGELGAYGKAIQLYRRALRAYKQHNDARGLAFVLANAGMAHQRRGNLHAALLTFEQGRDVARASANPRREAQFLVRIGNVEHALGQFERAEETQEQARALLGNAADPFALSTRGESLSGSGMALRQLGDPEEALRLNVRALELLRAAGRTQAELATKLNIAELQSEIAGRGVQEDPQAAARLVAQAQEAIAAVAQEAQRVGDHWLHAHALRLVGATHLAHGQLEESIAAFDSALLVARTGHVHEVTVRAHAGRAEALLAQDQPVACLEATEEAIGVLAPLVQGFSAEVGARARSRHARIFAVGLQAALRLNDKDAAFGLLERGRAGALLEWLEARDEIAEAIVPERLRDAEEEARGALAAASHRQAAVVGDPSLAVRRAARTAYDKALGEVASAVERIQAASQSAASLLYPQAASLRAVSARLSSTSRLLLFHIPPAVSGLASSPCLALVLGPTDSRLVRLAGADTVRAAVAAVRDAVTDPEIPAAAPLAALHALLVEPLALPEDLEQVIVSPEGALFEVPFAALFDGPRVSMAPSGTVLTHLQGLHRLRGEGVIAFGGPDYESLEHSPACLRLRPLPEAAKEAVAVGAPAFTGKEATEAAFVSAAARNVPWRGIHIACHGLFRPRQPMSTALALSRSPHDDGLLTLTDIFKLQVNAELVVLSACDTARGNVLPGDGLVGLARAFMTAGSRRVVASLWKVPDVPSRMLMERFHAHWNPKDPEQSPVPAAEALRRAQRDLVTAHPEWQHPYYWAAWQVWGRAD
jgi:tetratricopeptide (TPR) repeat protein